MMMRRHDTTSLNPLPLLFVLLFATVGVAHLDARTSDSEEEIKKRISGRYLLLNSLKQAGKIGETWDGMVTAREESFLDTTVEIDPKKEKRITLREFLKLENDDRKAVYAIIAKRTSTEDQPVTPRYVGMQSAKDLWKRAKPGHWLLTESGKWVKKPKPDPPRPPPR